MLPLFVLSKIVYAVWRLKYGLKKQGIVVQFLSGVREFALLQASRPAVDPFGILLHAFWGLLPLGRIDHCVKPTANLCQSLRLRISGAISPLRS